MLNPEVTTLLAGRYIEIKVQPLSFKEYLLFRQQENIEVKEAFDQYITYGGMLEQAYIFTRARRFDIKGKAWFKTNDKYFLADTGLRNQLIGFRGKDYGHLLENIVFNELQLRSNTVAIGKYNDLEVDFVTIDFGQRKYYQVTTSMLDPNVAKRELKVLQAISDDYPKIILTLDEHNIGDFEGIKVINVIKWFKQCKVKALAS